MMPLLGQPEALALSVHCVWSLAWKLLGEPFFFLLMSSLFCVKNPQGLGILCRWFGK